MTISEALLLVSVFVLLGMFLYNIKSFLYLDRVILPLLILSLGYGIAASLESGSWSPAVYSLVGSAILGLTLLSIYIKTKGNYFGFGDVKLGFIVGLLIGPMAAFLCLMILALLTVLYFFIARLPMFKRLSRLKISSAYFWIVSIVLSVTINHFL